MKIFLGVAAAILAVCGLAIGQESSYHAQASGKDIMTKMIGPNFGALRGMSENGPQTDEDWAAARTAAAIMAEAGQILNMGGRSKEGVWADAATGLASATGAVIAATDAKDVAAFKAAIGGIGPNCQSCHKVYRH
jgi:cytochrome c556